MKQKLLLLGAGTAIAGIVIGHYATLPARAHAAVLIDPSDSVIKNCSALAELTERWLSGKTGIQESSTLSLLVMGSDARNPEPTPPRSWSIPIAPDIVIGNDPAAFQREQQQMLNEVEQACETAKPGQRSPIYRMVKQGIAHLRASGCDPAGRCYVLIKTDLDEDVEPALRAVIERAAKDPSAAMPPDLVGSLNNAGIEILVCGLGEVRPRRGTSASPETRERIWRALFTNADLVSFQPYCK